MVMAICPACEGQIDLPGRVEMGQAIQCSHCLEELEVIDIDPLELDWAYDEDWDEDQEDEEEDML
jgi:lysine biosynthesis protein LysW